MAALFVLVGLVLALAGDCFLKAGNHLWVGLSLYALSGVPIWRAYKHATWMEVAMYWSILAILASAILGIAYFHEHLTARQWIAFGLGIVCVALWNWR